MRRRSSLLSAVVVLLAILLLPAFALAQDATPAAEEEAFEGITFEFLAPGFVEALPPAPADIDLARINFEPGAGFPVEADDPSLALALVESGEITVEVDIALTVTRAAAVTALETPEAAFPPATEEIAAGTAVVLAAGDSLVGPPNSSGEIRNDGAAPAVLLLLSVVPTGDADAATPAMAASPAADGGEEEAFVLPEGLRFQALAFAQVAELPAGPASLALVRITAEPGALFPEEETTEVELATIEAGSFLLRTTDGPPLVVWRGLATMDFFATPAAAPVIEEVGPGQEVTVTVGDGIYFPIGNVSEAEVVGNEPTVALLGFVGPAEAEDDGTPAP